MISGSHFCLFLLVSLVNSQVVCISTEVFYEGYELAPSSANFFFTSQMLHESVQSVTSKKCQMLRNRIEPYQPPTPNVQTSEISKKVKSAFARCSLRWLKHVFVLQHCHFITEFSKTDFFGVVNQQSTGEFTIQKGTAALHPGNSI